MLLLNGKNLSKFFGSKRLFANLSISIFANNHIGLIGQNGSGKSTLLKILAKQEEPDEGTLSIRSDITIGYVPQMGTFEDKSPLQILIDAQKPSEERERMAKTWLSKLGFTGEEPSALTLSGGWNKRLMIAREMVQAPDILLLDEPTNHLDLESILWLEKFLVREVPSYLVVSHDRAFLQATTNRIIELSPAYPQGVFAIEGSYEHFLSKREEFLQGQLEQERSMASKARKESAWLQSNPKARTTKSTARIDQAEELLEDLKDIRKRNTERKTVIEFVSSARETRKLLVAKNIGKGTLFQNLDVLLSPGSRLGLKGPNGCGKTTLLRILAGEITPDMGTLKRADKLQVVYFDQMRNSLPDHLSLREALSPTGDFVRFRGEPIHVNGWCKRFLFSPDLLDLPLHRLSGGERARISIAHLMLQPADLLLLDEPTNDLDIPTLETLESTLTDFPGALVLITHDRCMMDRLCHQFLSLGKPPEAPIPKIKTTSEKSSSKPSYLKKKELEQIEKKIPELEKELQELTALLNTSASVIEVCTAIGLVQTQIEHLYLRWEELT